MGYVGEGELIGGPRLDLTRYSVLPVGYCTCSVKRGAGLWIGARTLPSIGPDIVELINTQRDRKYVIMRSQTLLIDGLADDVKNATKRAGSDGDLQCSYSLIDKTHAKKSSSIKQTLST